MSEPCKIHLESPNSNPSKFIMKSLQSRLQDIYKSQDEIPQLIEVLASDKKQLIKDYYVKLNIILSSTDNGQLTSSESVAGAKEEIELKDIFSQRDGKNNKILILGGAGVGKSTLMQYIANQWANDKLWHDKFDLVYKISLKQFLRSGCENFVNQYEAADNELNAFIAYNIENGDTKAARKQVENIKLDDDRVLLLVDGYDEVSHLDEMGVYKAVKDSILSQKNVISV